MMRDRILGVSVEIETSSKSWRGDAVDYGAITQNGRVEAVAVERHELRLILRHCNACGYPSKQSSFRTTTKAVKQT